MGVGAVLSLDPSVSGPAVERLLIGNLRRTSWRPDRVDETSSALRLLDAFHLTFAFGKHLFMLELASVTTAQGHTCISQLGRRISLEWCIWRLQQHGSQQQRGQLFGVLWLIRVVVAVLASAIGRVARKRPSGRLVLCCASAGRARSA